MPLGDFTAKGNKMSNLPLVTSPVVLGHQPRCHTYMPSSKRRENISDEGRSEAPDTLTKQERELQEDTPRCASE